MLLVVVTKHIGQLDADTTAIYFSTQICFILSSNSTLHEEETSCIDQLVLKTINTLTSICLKSTIRIIRELNIFCNRECYVKCLHYRLLIMYLCMFESLGILHFTFLITFFSSSNFTL